MRVLVLGGSWFLGRVLSWEALARGWHVTAFTRGRSGALPAGVEHVVGDRRQGRDLRRLAEHGAWDVTVDTSAYAPVDVAGAVAALGTAAGRYVLISTVSAYRDWPASPVDEGSPLWPSRPEMTEDDRDLAAVDGAFQYGVLKAGCELAARTAPGGSLIFRPGVILGPGEYVGRMLALLNRAARGGRWLLAGPPDRLIQPVDVRDVSRFAVDRIAVGDEGVYNVTAPVGYATYGELIDECVAVTGGAALPVWADADWLAARGVGQWMELPLWRTAEGTWRVDGSKAQQAGLRCRPMRDLVRDTYADFQRHPPVASPRQAEHGMAEDRELSLLAAWDAHVGSRGQ